MNFHKTISNLSVVVLLTTSIVFAMNDDLDKPDGIVQVQSQFKINNLGPSFEEIMTGLSSQLTEKELQFLRKNQSTYMALARKGSGLRSGWIDTDAMDTRHGALLAANITPAKVQSFSNFLSQQPDYQGCSRQQLEEEAARQLASLSSVSKSPPPDDILNDGKAGSY